MLRCHFKVAYTERVAEISFLRNLTLFDVKNYLFCQFMHLFRLELSADQDFFLVHLRENTAASELGPIVEINNNTLGSLAQRNDCIEYFYVRLFARSEENNITTIMTNLITYAPTPIEPMEHYIERPHVRGTSHTTVEVERIQTVPNCSICLTLPVNTLFSPCHHACSCASCHAHLLICPICRSTIHERTEIFL